MNNNTKIQRRLVSVFGSFIFLLLGCSFSEKDQNSNSVIEPKHTEEVKANLNTTSSQITSIEPTDTGGTPAAKPDDVSQNITEAVSPTGIIKILRLDPAAFSREMNTRATPNSVFFVSVDDRPPVKISRTDGGEIDSLDLKGTHTVTIRLNNRVDSSFKFSFKQFRCAEMTLKYKADHGVWVLVPSNG